MDDIAALAGLTKRTLYNNYPDKSALFVQIAADAIAYAEQFARGLHEEFTVGITAANLPAKLNDLGERLALGIARPTPPTLVHSPVGRAAFRTSGHTVRTASWCSGWNSKPSTLGLSGASTRFTGAPAPSPARRISI
jgi:AcrR family transcriptional regulator